MRLKTRKNPKYATAEWPTGIMMAKLLKLVYAGGSFAAIVDCRTFAAQP